MSAQSARRLQKFSSSHSLLRILISIDVVGYSCSKVTGKRSRNASLRTLVPMNRPSSEPPLVLAVAKIWNPLAGTTNLPIFFRKTPLPSRMDCRHRILLDAGQSHPAAVQRHAGVPQRQGIPLCHTVSPLTRRKPPIRSSSSVSIVMLTRISSRPSWAHACSIENVLPLPERPVMNVG